MYTLVVAVVHAGSVLVSASLSCSLSLVAVALCDVTSLVMHGHMSISHSVTYYASVMSCHCNRQQLVTKRLLQQALYHIPTTYTMPLQGIGSGQRQLIAVTCIAEHA